jgi:hypothetical protein
MSRFVLAILTFVAVFASGCSNQELQRIEDASSKRAMICSAVDDLASLAPSAYTARAQQACKAGEDLRSIAAAYAGCYEPLPGVSDPVPVAPATGATPVPVASPEEPPTPTPAVAEGG